MVPDPRLRGSDSTLCRSRIRRRPRSDHGDQVEETVVASPEPTYGDQVKAGALGPSDETTAEDLETAGARKYYVDDSEVFVTAQSVYVIDPGDQRLRVVAYDNFAADQVRRLYPKANDLRARWRTAGGRDEVVQELTRRGVTFEELAERTGLLDADPFDLLVHLAWNAPLVTRRDRVNRLKREQRAFLEQFSPRQGTSSKRCWRNTPIMALPSSTTSESSRCHRSLPMAHPSRLPLVSAVPTNFT